MDKVACIRHFNRTLTQQIGLLNDHYLDRGRSMAASRVLFEIGRQDIAVRELRVRLGLDSGYMSRLLRTLEKEGLVAVRPAPDDSRVRLAALTAAGVAELATLNQLSDQAAELLLARLSEPQQQALTQAMSTITQLLRTSAIAIEVADADGEPARYCLQQYFHELNQRFNTGFSEDKGLPANAEDFTPPHGYFIVATLNGQPLGCGAMKCANDHGYIKRMWVAAESRGLGLGQRILARLEELARNHGLSRVRLETNRALPEAQQLYKKCGYSEVEPFNTEYYADFWFEKNLEPRSKQPGSK